MTLLSSIFPSPKPKNRLHPFFLRYSQINQVPNSINFTFIISQTCPLSSIHTLPPRIWQLFPTLYPAPLQSLSMETRMFFLSKKSDSAASWWHGSGSGGSLVIEPSKYDNLVFGTYFISCPHLSSSHVSRSMSQHIELLIFSWMCHALSHFQACTRLLPLFRISSFFHNASFLTLRQNIPASGSLCWHPKANLDSLFFPQ